MGKKKYKPEEIIHKLRANENGTPTAYFEYDAWGSQLTGAGC